MSPAAIFARAARPRACRARAPRPYRLSRFSTGQAAAECRRRALPGWLHWPRSRTRLDATRAHRPMAWPLTEVGRPRSVFLSMGMPFSQGLLLSPGAAHRLTCLKSKKWADIALLTQINSRGVGSPRMDLHG